jgi:hypothetical protein
MLGTRQDCRYCVLALVASVSPQPHQGRPASVLLVASSTGSIIAIVAVCVILAGLAVWRLVHISQR